MDRKIGLNFDAIKLVLVDIARFHASFLAFKLKRPEIFEKTVRPYAQNFKMPPSEGDDFAKKLFKELIKDDEECVKLAPKVKFWSEVTRCAPREPFATIMHTDLWTNNTMQIFEGDKAVANKLVDFQVYTYGSPASDIFFLLWSSLQKPMLEENLDFLIEFYHNEFTKTLQEHNCDIKPFNYENFMEEMKLEAAYEFPHAIEFLIMLSVGEDENTWFSDVREVAKRASQHFKEKLFYMVKECNKRGWLY